MENLKNFIIRYRGAIIGGIVAIIALILRIHKFLIGCIIILAGILIGHYIQKNQNTHSFQMLMEQSQESTTYWDTKLNKFRSIEIISSIFSDHNAMKLEINHGKRKEKKPTIWRLNNMLLKNQWVNEEIKKEIKKQHTSTSHTVLHKRQVNNVVHT